MKIFEYIEKPEKIKRLKIVCLIVLAVVVALDFPIPRDHAAYWWDVMPGFDAVYGLISCLVIIFGSKAIGKLGIVRQENYYQEDEDDD